MRLYQQFTEPGLTIVVLFSCTVSGQSRCSTLLGAKSFRLRQWSSRARSLRTSRRVAVRQMCSGRSPPQRRLSSTAITAANCGTVNAGVSFFPPAGLARQEPRGDQRQHLMVVPPGPGPHLVVRQTRLTLGPLEALLDAMSRLRHTGELGHRRVRRGVGQVVVDL